MKILIGTISFTFHYFYNYNKLTENIITFRKIWNFFRIQQIGKCSVSATEKVHTYEEKFFFLTFLSLGCGRNTKINNYIFIEMQ